MMKEKNKFYQDLFSIPDIEISEEFLYASLLTNIVSEREDYQSYVDNQLEKRIKLMVDLNMYNGKIHPASQISEKDIVDCVDDFETFLDLMSIKDIKKWIDSNETT